VLSHSVLLCRNLYSTNLHNSLRTCSILLLVLSTQTSWTAFSVILEPLIILRHGPHRKHMSRVWLRDHWSVASTGRGANVIENSASSIITCWTVFTEPLPGKTLIKSVTVCSICFNINFVHKVYPSWYDSQNRRRLFHCRASTVWSL
jgi:hypothetical protein